MVRRSLSSISHRRIAAFVATATLCLFVAEACAAIELSLPTVGTQINYDFIAEQPHFLIANDVPVDELLYNRIRFADERRLRTDGTFLAVTLTLRGEGIADLMEPLWIPFDEIMSIDSDDDSFFAIGTNTSVTGDDARDHYGFGWSFTVPSGSRIRGITWNITPDLIPRVQLPANLDLEMYIWGDGPIVVVPEPGAIAATLALLAGVWATREGKAERCRSG